MSTPTGKPRGRRMKVRSHLRRRIIDKDSQESDAQNDKEIESQKDMAEQSPAESTGSTSSTVVFEPKSSRTRSGNASLFYKSIMTPSRLKKRKSKERYKSFHRTPKIMPVKNDYSIKKAPKTPQSVKNKWREQVQNIVNKHWKVCYLSTMMGFRYTKKNLKQAYIRTLKIRILDEYPSYHSTVTVTPSSFLYQNPKRTDSLFIKVTSLSLSDETGEQHLRTVYEALLVRSKNVQSVSLANTDWFPLMLYSGLDVVHNVVVRWLQVSFGCYITPRGINATSMLWLSAAWTHGQCTNGRHKEIKDRIVSFHYYAALDTDDPKYRNEKGLNIKMSIKANTVMQIWKKVMGTRPSNELTSEDVASFHRKIECILFVISKIPKDLISLLAVQTPCNAISRTGKVRITCEKSFHSLLQHLIECFENICHFQNLDNELEEEFDIETEKEA